MAACEKQGRAPSPLLTPTAAASGGGGGGRGGDLDPGVPHLGVDLVQAPDAHYEGQLRLGLHVEALGGLGLPLQPDQVLLLEASGRAATASNA